MPPLLAFLLTASFILYLFKMDFKHKSNVSPALWIPWIWMMIVGSRPVTSWMYSERGYTSPDQLLAGSPMDRNIFILLIVTGLYILSRRKIDWSWTFNNNLYVFLFFLYCGISILWSDFPFVSLKRWIKGAGSLVMILVVLTESDPVNGIKTLIKRCANVLVPSSILLIKYYPHLGRGYHPWSGVAFNTGVSYGKNGLGYSCLVFGVFFSWRFLAGRGTKSVSFEKKENIMFLLMISWLLDKADSATSLMSLIIGICVMICLSFIKKNVRYLGAFIFALVLFFLFLHLSIDLYETATSSLGRDITLTGRTEIWEEVIGMTTRPLIGTGYESFWLGERAEKLWEKYWWHPNQAHNGYIETYINLGMIGLLLLTGILVSAYKKASATLLFDFDYGRFRIAILCMALLYNITEAAFKGLHLIFFIFLLISLDVTRKTIPNYID